jgi:hypothetical protein
LLALVLSLQRHIVFAVLHRYWGWPAAVPTTLARPVAAVVERWTAEFTIVAAGQVGVVFELQTELAQLAALV